MFLNGNVIFNDFGRCFLGLFSVCFWSSGSIVRNSFFSFRLRSFLACLIAKMFFIKLWRFWRFRDGGFGILRLMIMIIIPLLVACKTWRRRWINFILGGTFRLDETKSLVGLLAHCHFPLLRSSNHYTLDVFYLNRRCIIYYFALICFLNRLLTLLTVSFASYSLLT